MKTSVNKIAVLLGFMCFLLTTGIYIQIKTVGNSGTAVAKTNTENELRNSVLEMKEKYENTYKKLAKKEKELSDLIDSASKNNSESAVLSERLNKLNSVLGFSRLEGPGIEIIIEDGDAPANALNASDYIVHDENLLMIVNYLFNVGAEAVSINDERVVSTTAITCIGSTIKVNDQKVTSPFTIKAIGNKNILYGIKIQYGYLDNLEAQGGVKITVSKSDSVVIEKYDGIYKFEYAVKAE